MKGDLKMNADICDICKKPIGYENSLTGGIKQQYIVKIKSIEEGFSIHGYMRRARNLDVCATCMNKFVKFIEGDTCE